jgi:catechol 2,3-dioxygenase-like lactoylglutathione lyase family enzyme
MAVTIGHINIRTERLEETIAFFGAVFGFTRGDAATMPSQDGNAWLFDDMGTPLIHLNRPRAGAASGSTADGALDHVAFNCDDLPAMRARLEAAGIAYTEVQTRVPGLVQLNCTDPNGVRLELAFGHEAAQRPA